MLKDDQKVRLIGSTFTDRHSAKSWWSFWHWCRGVGWNLGKNAAPPNKLIYNHVTALTGSFPTFGYRS